VESYLSRTDDHLAAGWLADDPETRRDTQGQIKAIRATVAMNASDADLAVPLGQQALAELHLNNTGIRSVVTLDLADASLGRDDLPEAVRLYPDALYTAQPTGNAIISINAMSKLARLQFIQGNLHAAAESYHESFQALQRWGWENQPVAGLITIGMASLLYEWNTLDQALAYAHTSLERLRQWGHPSHIAEALITLAKIEHARDHPDLAEEHLTAAMQHARRHNLRLTERRILETRARLALSIGERTLAKSIFDQARHRFPQPLPKGSLTNLSIVRPLILEQRYEDAKKVLSEQQDYTEERGLVAQRIEASVLQALDALAQGRRDTAHAALQIAETLFVSVNTVKTHIRRLYSKLSAGSRLEAVTRARTRRVLIPSSTGLPGFQRSPRTQYVHPVNPVKAPPPCCRFSNVVPSPTPRYNGNGTEIRPANQRTLTDEDRSWIPGSPSTASAWSPAGAPCTWATSPSSRASARTPTTPSSGLAARTGTTPAIPSR